MPSGSEDKAAIKAIVDKVFDTYAVRDLEGMLSCYAPDLVTMMPFGQPTYGLDAWRDVLVGAFERNDIVSLDHDIEEITLLGDHAWEWHNEWSTQRHKSNPEVFTVYIRGAQLLQRQPNGEWKISRYIANVVPIEGDVEEHKRAIRSNRK